MRALSAFFKGLLCFIGLTHARVKFSLKDVNAVQTKGLLKPNLILNRSKKSREIEFVYRKSV